MKSLPLIWWEFILIFQDVMGLKWVYLIYLIRFQLNASNQDVLILLVSYAFSYPVFLSNVCSSGEGAEEMLFSNGNVPFPFDAAKLLAFASQSKK